MPKNEKNRGILRREEFTTEQEQIARLVDATILDRLTSIDDLLAKNAELIAELLYELRKVGLKSPAVIETKEGQLVLAPTKASQLPSFEVTYPSDGSFKTLQIGTTVIDFYTGVVTQPDSTTEHLSTPLKQYGYETIGAIFLEVSKAIKFHYDEHGLEQTSSEALVFHNRLNFRKLYITTTEATRISITTTTDPDAIFAKTTNGVLPVRRIIDSIPLLHFAGAIVINAKEDANLLPIVSNKITITRVAIMTSQNQNFRLIFWATDAYDEVVLTDDRFLGFVDLPVQTSGFQIAGAGWYYLEKEIEFDYEDLDATYEIHCSLMPLTGAKAIGANTKISLTYAPRT